MIYLVYTFNHYFSYFMGRGETFGVVCVGEKAKSLSKSKKSLYMFKYWLLNLY